MSVKTGGVEPARGKWRIYWWFMVVFALVCLGAAVIIGRPVLGTGVFILFYPLQRLFWRRQETDPSKTGWEQGRERLGSDKLG